LEYGFSNDHGKQIGDTQPSSDNMMHDGACPSLAFSLINAWEKNVFLSNTKEDKI
jgi:hypothetical protein